MSDGSEIQREYDRLEAHRDRVYARRVVEWRRYDKEREREV